MVLFEELAGKYGHLGLITLNRPQAYNALSLDMFVALSTKLKEWQFNEHVKAVVIKGEGGKAFCAGGDIKIYYENRHHPVHELIKFFWHEYRFNYQLHQFSKPYISFLDGITMGGGAGVSIHGSHRIGTERLKFAMPETGIGLYPDIGGSYFLPRCPGKIGWYLGLSGEVIDVADAKYAGLINYQIQSSQLPQVLTALLAIDFSHSSVIDDVLKQFALESTASTLVQHRGLIDHCFSQDSIEAIFAALETANDPWCHHVLSALKTRSPTSLKVVFQQLTKGAQLDFAECMRMEYRMTYHFLQRPDFYEGIRAALIDKDKKPQWQPSNLNQVGDVSSFFDPLPIPELTFA